MTTLSNTESGTKTTYNTIKLGVTALAQSVHTTGNLEKQSSFSTCQPRFCPDSKLIVNVKNSNAYVRFCQT